MFGIMTYRFLGSSVCFEGRAAYRGGCRESDGGGAVLVASHGFQNARGAT